METSIVWVTPEPGAQSKLRVTSISVSFVLREIVACRAMVVLRKGVGKQMSTKSDHAGHDTAHDLRFYSPQANGAPPCRASPPRLLRVPLMPFLPQIFFLFFSQAPARPNSARTSPGIGPGQPFPPVLEVPVPYAQSARPGYSKNSPLPSVHGFARAGTSSHTP